MIARVLEPSTKSLEVHLHHFRDCRYILLMGNATEVDVQIGNTIRERREKLGLTQAALGKAIGVTFQQVQKYERGVNRVAAATLLKAAEAKYLTTGSRGRTRYRATGLNSKILRSRFTMKGSLASTPAGLFLW